MEFIEIHCSAPSKEVAQSISNALLEQKLAACIQIIEQMNSIYTYEGKRCEESEVLMLIKSKASLFDDVTTLIEALHPYEVTEITAFEIKQINKKYKNWLSETL